MYTERTRFLHLALMAVLLVLALSVQPLFALDMVPDQSGHVARAAGHTTRFDGNAVEIAGPESERAEQAPAARFQLLEIQKGAAVLANRGDGDPQVKIAGRRIEYARRAGLVERYDILEEGIEQSFVLQRRLAHPGDLLITVSLEGDRELGNPFPDGSGGFYIPFLEGGWRLHYGAATAIDAAGKRRAVPVAIADGRVTLSVDGAWLARAAYPVLVDPWIGIERNGDFQGRPAAAFNFGGSPSFPDVMVPQYLVAYESNNGGGAMQIWGKRLDSNGTNLGMGSSSAYDKSLNISANSTVAHSRPTVAFKFGRLDKPKRNYLVAWERSDRALGYRLLDKSGNPLTAPRTITASSPTTLKDVTAAAGPQGGWMESTCGTTVGCSPYLLAYRSVGLLTAGPYSNIRLAVVDDGNGSLWKDVLVESLGFVDDRIYAPSIAYGHSAAANYYVLAYRRPDGTIVVRKVDKFGTPGTAYTVPSSSSISAPVVAYNFANNRWAVFWRASSYNRILGTTVVAIQGKMFGWTSGGAFVDGPSVTAASSAIPEFYTAKDILPDFWVAGSQTAAEVPSGQGLFEVAYVDNTRPGEVFSIKIFNDGSRSSTTRLTSNSQADRYVKLATTRIDPLTSGYAPPLACTGAPGSRCALWVFEHFYSATDHDLEGSVTPAQY